MNEQLNPILNDRGSGLIVVLLILAAITIIGIAALNTSHVEILLSQNDLIYKQNLYNAEGAAMEGAQKLENTLSDDFKKKVSGQDDTVISWLLTDKVDMGDMVNWTEYSYAVANAATSQSSLTSVYLGPSGGASLDAGNTSILYSFRMYGLCQGNGTSLVEIGYKKRF